MNETPREQSAQTAAPVLPQQQPARPSQAPSWSPIDWWVNMALMHQRYETTIRAFLSLVSRATNAEHAQRLFEHEFAKFEPIDRKLLLQEIIRQCPGHELYRLASNALEQEHIPSGAIPIPHKNASSRHEENIALLDQQWGGPHWLPPDVRAANVYKGSADPGQPTKDLVTEMVRITTLVTAKNIPLYLLWKEGGALRDDVSRRTAQKSKRSGAARLTGKDAKNIADGIVDGSIEPVAGWNDPPPVPSQSLSTPVNSNLQVTNRGSVVNERIPYHDMGRAASQESVLEGEGSDPAASGSTTHEGGNQRIFNVPIRNQGKSHLVTNDPVCDREGSDPFANYNVSFSHINRRIEATLEAEDYANGNKDDGEDFMQLADDLDGNDESADGDLPPDYLPVDDLSPNDPPPDDATQNETDVQEGPADTNPLPPTITDEALPSLGSKRTHDEMNGTPSATFIKYKDFVARLKRDELEILNRNAKKDLAQAEADKAVADRALGMLEGRAQARPENLPEAAEIMQARDQHEKAVQALAEAKKRVTALGHIERARYLHDNCIEAKDYRRKVQELLNETEERVTAMEKAYHEAFRSAEEEGWAGLIAAERQRQSNR
ncbi:hypothetical protein NW768_002379 [Fusarium equiseti]|uniref:Uncharacterized protein n=1 Tax=Fusarium equiseti TaxID=61235 RepID=A0ABQ8RNI4_FUSEQ|nr:hypothetical protein NW768_002379 [Fusarium equiseti]